MIAWRLNSGQHSVPSPIKLVRLHTNAAAAQMSEHRLIELETRLAYQDETLRVLGDEMAQQQRRIEMLERRWQEMSKRLAALAQAPTGPAPADEKPPHY